MFYKCEDCGNIFEEGEQATWSENLGEHFGAPYREERDGCPMCHGDYHELYECRECGSYFEKEELHEGCCYECLDCLIDYDIVLEYLNNRNDGLIDFYFEYLEVDPGSNFKSSFHFEREIEEWFLRMKLNDKILEKKEFFEVCRSFIMSSSEEIYYFADWYFNNKIKGGGNK